MNQHLTPRWQMTAGLLLIVLLTLLRQLLEARMLSHMLLQFPLLLLAGALLVPALPNRLGGRLGRYNQIGITGLTLAAGVSSLWMIPRLLDLVVASTAVDAAKFASLILTGFALRLSWPLAVRTMQAFFLIGWAMMSATVGLLYQDAPVRLCNSYLGAEQTQVGSGLIVLSAALVICWFGLLLGEQPTTRPAQRLH
ncbi:hypothetical protein [Chitinimonas sp.]|uniref:hypothetical protein n=1 Tax=Chitinimonas sp. TaxID=1934313 RepID=UPI002F94155F